MSEPDIQVTPRVSVIVPTYNGEKFIERALKSALNQTFRDFEIIVVDDASSDRTKEKVRALAEKDRRIKLIELTQNSGGGAVPRTVGCKAVQGELVAFLDQDDLYMPEYLETKIAYFDIHPEIESLSSLAWTFNDETKKIINYEYGGPVNTMMRASALKAAGYFKASETNIDDMGMGYRFLKIYGLKSSAMISGGPLTLYARHGNQESNTQNRNPSIFIKRIDAALVSMDDNASDPGIKDILSVLYSRKANFYCLAGDFKQGRNFFKKSLKIKFNFFSLPLLMVSYFPYFYYTFFSVSRFFQIKILGKIKVAINKMKYNKSYRNAEDILVQLFEVA